MDSSNVIVETLSGLAEDQTHPTYAPRSGFSDGTKSEARFAYPSDVTCDENGVVFVADTYNHVIRQIEIDGTTTTLAGTIEFSEEDEGCPAPCIKGVSGYADGNLTNAKFYFPSSVSIGPSGTILVADGHRIRRVNRLNVPVEIQGVTSKNRVVTIAGQIEAGEWDDSGHLATFDGKFLCLPLFTQTTTTTTYTSNVQVPRV